MSEPDAAVAIVQSHQKPQSILLIRRAEREGDSWSGHWSFPGGWRQASDPDPLCAAIRELEEECGVLLRREQMERALPNSFARRRVGRHVLVAPFLFGVDAEFITVLNAREAAEALWVPVALLLDPAQHALRPAPWRPEDMLFPSVMLNGVPLWGFTYRLITDWLELVPKGDAVERAGWQAADAVLEFLRSRGLTQIGGWSDRGDGVKATSVSAPIPADAVLAHFTKHGPPFPTMNTLEVRPDFIRIAGLAWEEYLIYAPAGGASA